MSFANMMAPSICDRALVVNTRAHNLVTARAKGNNASMHKRKRDTPLSRLMAGYNNGRGISDNALAKALAIPQPTVSRHASGDVRDAKDSTLEKFAAFFGVTTDYLRGKGPNAQEPFKRYGDLSPLALDIAKRWQALSPDRQEWFRDLLFTLHFVEEKFPAFKKGRPRGESYNHLEQAIRDDFRQLKLKFDP